MPFLNVKISAPPSPELSRRVAEGLSEITARVLKKRPDLTSIAVGHVPPEHWSVAGRSLAEQGKASFWLDVKVTDGTNSKDEKAAYVREVFSFMAETLDRPLHEESYVLVDEVRGDAYGYGGLTQEHRHVAGKLAAA